MKKRVTRLGGLLAAYQRRDPAARSKLEIFLLYPGVHAIINHRIAHWLYLHHRFFLARCVSQWSRFWTGIEIHPGATIGHRLAHWLYCHNRKFLARCVSQWSRFWTGIEIHPGAKIGRRLVIDHGMGIVVGETAEIGDDVLLYQCVTLGGTGKEKGKRHPTIGNNVMIGAGAKVLGPFSVGDNTRIAAGAVVLSEVPANSTAVGVPAKIVRVSGKPVYFADDVDQIHMEDPVLQELSALSQRISALERVLKNTQEERTA